jgi:hypothetical protein
VIEKKLPKNVFGSHSDLIDAPPGRRPGKIWIDPELTPRDYLETLLHEGLHEFAPYLDEHAVRVIGDGLERLVTRAGYMRVFPRGKRCAKLRKA